MPRLFAALSTLSVLALAAPAPDAPYEEQVPVARRPLAGAWAADAIPTGWSALPCSALLSRAKGSSIGPLVLCASAASPGDVLLYAPRGDGAALTITGGPSPADLARGVLAAAPGAPGAGAAWTAALLVPGSAVYTLSCAPAAGSCAATAVGGIRSPPPTIAAAAAYPSETRAGYVTVWASGSDTMVYDLPESGGGAAGVTLAGPLGWGATALAYSALLGEVAAGNDTKVVYIPAASPGGPPSKWEWVSNVTSGDGGVYDDVVTAMAFDDVSGNLYVGTPSALDVRSPDGVVHRIGGLKDGGLPFGNLTSLAVDGATRDWPTPRLWLGTTRGAILLDPAAPSEFGRERHAAGGGGRSRRHPVFAAAAAREAEASAAAVAAGRAAPTPPPLRQRWRYFYGPRYLSGAQAAVFGSDAGLDVVSDGADTTVLDRGAGGLAVLQAQSWTLARKAAVYEAALPRHTRLGQVSSCSLPSLGVLAPCTTGPDDNDGLWTSLTVSAEAMRYALTGDPAARDAAWTHWEGMHLLMRATGIRGLISRSVLAPGSVTGSGTWHNSTVVGLEGYLWKGDASSDEVDGHLMAYPLVAALVAGGPSPQPANASLVRGALVDMVRYIVVNNFTLVDVTGAPTSWGHWDPATINTLRRDWCDTRGLNSLEMMAMLAAGLAATAPGDPDHSLFLGAWAALAGPAPGADYLGNLLNQKITTPSDWNDSDDELAAFAYTAFFFAGNASGSVPAAARAAVAASLRRTLDILRGERPGIWDALGAASLGVPMDEGAVADTLWNLRTWPLDLIDWPVANSQRLDIIIDPNVDRQFRSGGASLSVLPANERAQTRWNSSPHDLDGGSGMNESDPGAFLLSYWATRWAGGLAAAAAAAAE